MIVQRLPRVSILLLALLILACGESQEPPMRLSKQPVSVRGWIGSLASPPEPGAQVEQFEMAERVNAFRASAVSVDNVPWASGGLADTGSFIILDVPPGDFTLLFQIENVGDVRLPLKQIPGNADVLIPGLVIRPDGVDVADPSKIVVRVPGEEAKPTGQTAMVGKYSVPIVQATLTELKDRRDYPVSPDQPEGPAAIGVTIQR